MFSVFIEHIFVCMDVKQWVWRGFCARYNAGRCVVGIVVDHAVTFSPKTVQYFSQAKNRLMLAPFLLSNRNRTLKIGPGGVVSYATYVAPQQTGCQYEHGFFVFG